MHRHGARLHKLGREKDQRRALVKGLATALVEYESIETTLPRAKAVVPYTEKLITKAKKNTLHSRRQVVSGLTTADAAHRLMDEVAPKLSGRTSGHLRIEKSDSRRGDNAPMARVSFVDDLSVEKKPTKAAKKPTAASKSDTKAETKPKAEATEAKESK